MTPQLETVIIEVTRSIPVFSITEGSRYTLLIVCKYCGVIPILFGWFLRALSLYLNKMTCTTIYNHRLSYTYEKHSYNAIASFIHAMAMLIVRTCIVHLTLIPCSLFPVPLLP